MKKDKLGYKTQLEVIKQHLNYFTQATLEEAKEENTEKELPGADESNG